MILNLIKIENTEWISGRELQKELGIIQTFTHWFKKQVDRAFLISEKDFMLLKTQSTGGRPSNDYLITNEAAKRIAIVSHTKESKKIIDYLLKLESKKQNLELITVKEAAFAMKVVNCLKYINNQKEAYSLHQNLFIEENNDKINPKYIYAEFAKYRANIVGWDKEKTDKAITEYLNNHSGYNRNKLQSSNMQIKLSVMDIGEAIRIAVLDILYSKHEDKTLAANFSILCKNLAKEMQIEPDKENSKNLFRDKEQIESVKAIELIK